MGKLIKKIGFEIELFTNEYGDGEIRNINDNQNLGLDFSDDGSIEAEGGRDCDNCEAEMDEYGDRDCDNCNGSGSYGLEVKTEKPKNYTEIIRVANHLFPVLKKLEHDREVGVNDSCGLHIHFDITDLSVKELRNNHNNWSNWGEDWFYKIIPNNRRNNTYANSIKGMSFPKWLKDNRKYWSASPHFLDVWEVPTVEYRLFQSTLNRSHFLNYLRLIKLFIDSRGIQSEFDRKVEKNKALMAFCLLRRKAYN